MLVNNDQQKKALAQVLYPWIADSRVKLVWFSRVVYALSVAVATFGHKECMMISEIVGIQIFFSLMGMNRESNYTSTSRLLRTFTSAVIGISFSAFITLSLFCFEGIALLFTSVIDSTAQPTYVSYLTPVIFVTLATTWFVVARVSNAADSSLD